MLNSLQLFYLTPIRWLHHIPDEIYKPKYMPETIIRIVSRYYQHQATLEDMVGPSRVTEIKIPRQICIFLIISFCDITLRDAGMLFNRDHTTVIHSRQKVRDLMDTDEKIKAQVERLISIVERNADDPEVAPRIKPKTYRTKAKREEINKIKRVPGVYSNQKSLYN